MGKKKIIIAPNAYKGAISATEAGKAIQRGLLKAGITSEMIEIPIADGGDGSLEVIANYLDLTIRKTEVQGPLGKAVTAHWGYNDKKKLAVIEMAEASGLRLLSSDQLDPLKATTLGTGQLIREAIASGAEEIYLTVGGSATVDLGMGILQALGAKCYSKDGPIKNLRPAEFLEVKEIDLGSFQISASIKILSDVTNPLLGENGSAAVFGPQKGADTAMVKQLEAGLSHMAALLEQTAGKEIVDLKGGGAAGGITAGLYAAVDAEIIDGADQILRWADFDQHLEDATLLITGEGRIDSQTNFGKGPGLVAKRARAKGIKVIGLSGSLPDDTSAINNFDQLIAISNPNDPLELSILNTAQNLEDVASQVIL